MKATAEDGAGQTQQGFRPLKRGMWFEHARYLAPGGTAANPTPARCVITKTQDGRVYYRQLGANRATVYHVQESFADVVKRWLAPDEAARAIVEDQDARTREQ
uniref:hypothetical protein n=1 Tax=Nonomuraea sp. CA-251285 TaxID=3240002 RepID=UPI003F490E2D